MIFPEPMTFKDVSAPIGMVMNPVIISPTSITTLAKGGSASDGCAPSSTVSMAISPVRSAAMTIVDRCRPGISSTAWGSILSARRQISIISDPRLCLPSLPRCRTAGRSVSPRRTGARRPCIYKRFLSMDSLIHGRISRGSRSVMVSTSISSCRRSRTSGGQPRLLTSPPDYNTGKQRPFVESS